MAFRARAGYVIYAAAILALGLVLEFSGSRQPGQALFGVDRLGVITVASALLIGASLYRRQLIARCLAWPPALPDFPITSWYRQFVLAVLVQPLIWGLLTAWLISRAAPAPAQVLALSIACLSVGSSIGIFAASPVITTIYPLAMFGPTFAILASRGDRTAIVVAAGLGLFMPLALIFSLRIRLSDRIGRKRAKELAATRQDLLEAQQLLDLAHDAIIVLDPATEIVLEANARACEIYGFERSELIGMSMRSISRSVEEGNTHVQETLQRKTPYYAFETHQYRKDGTELVLEVHASRVTFSGRPAILSINRDITGRRRTEEMRLAKEAAERASAAKSEFVTTLSHEIRTPLTSLVGAAELLSQQDTDAATSELLNTLSTSADSLRQLVDNVLDLSKIEARHVTLERIRFDLRHTLNACVDMFSSQARDKNLELDFTWDERLEPHVEGDVNRLRQVVINLLSNALKFTEHGRIELSAEARDIDGVEISVRDSGIGIASQSKDLLFGDYQQADASTSRLYGGTGLGLAICKRLVELMGGEIGVDSNLGEGSTFWIAIPLRPRTPDVETADAQQAPLETRTRETRNAPGAPKGLIVVADDNELSRKITERYVSDMGYATLSASDGVEVLETLHYRRPDLILMDCRMPRLDGFATAQRIRDLDEERRHIPIIALTANALDGDDKLCIQAGMNAYLAKPFRREALAGHISRLLHPETESAAESAPHSRTETSPPDDASVDAAGVESRLQN